MDNSNLDALLDRDVDDISKAAIALERDDRRRTLSLAAELLLGSQDDLRALKTLRLVQAALSQEGNGKFPVAEAHSISNAALRVAGQSDAHDVYRAAVDVMRLLAVKSDAERSNLSLAVNLLETWPRDPHEFNEREVSTPGQAPAEQARTAMAGDRKRGA